MARGSARPGGWSGKCCPALMNEILKPVCRHIQGGGLKRVFFFRRFSLRTQDLVDLVLDVRQVRLLVGMSYPMCEDVERIQRFRLRIDFAGPEELPAHRRDRCKCA